MNVSDVRLGLYIQLIWLLYSALSDKWLKNLIISDISDTISTELPNI